MDESEPSQQQARDTRVPLWAVVLVFVGGLGAGIVVVGLLGLGTPAFPTEQASGSSATTAPGGGQVSVAAQAQVNAACLRAINEAESVSGILTDVPGAAQEVDLARLDEIVRQLQPIQPRLQQDLQDCRVSVEAAGGSPSPTSSAVTAAPTGSVSAVPSQSSEAGPTPGETPTPTSAPS